MRICLRRREFLAALGGAAAARPLAAGAQQPERMRRIGVLSAIPADDPESTARTAAFLQTLQELGWTDGRNVRIEMRWGGGDAGRLRRYAAELVALAPDVILTNGSAGVTPVLEATRTIPVVFAQVTDPVGAGLVESLARPGGNATGFTLFEFSTSGKWVELLKEIAPAVTRAVVLRDPTSTTGLGQFAAVQSAASLLGVELRPVDIRRPEGIERAVTGFAQAPNGGLIIANTQFAFFHRELIIALAARYRLPAVYPYRSLVRSCPPSSTPRKG
jgi:putative ABC transport system substrate-binding protein